MDIPHYQFIFKLQLTIEPTQSVVIPEEPWEPQEIMWCPPGRRHGHWSLMGSPGNGHWGSSAQALLQSLMQGKVSPWTVYSCGEPTTYTSVVSLPLATNGTPGIGQPITCESSAAKVLMHMQGKVSPWTVYSPVMKWLCTSVYSLSMIVWRMWHFSPQSYRIKCVMCWDTGWSSRCDRQSLVWPFTGCNEHAARIKLCVLPFCTRSLLWVSKKNIWWNATMYM